MPTGVWGGRRTAGEKKGEEVRQSPIRGLMFDYCMRKNIARDNVYRDFSIGEVGLGRDSSIGDV